MRVLKSQPQRFSLTWNEDQMDVVGHEAVSNQGYPVQSEALDQQIEIDTAMGIAVKDRSSSVAALGDMVGQIETDHARQARHASDLHWPSDIAGQTA